jgi:hypothetical protein
MREAWRELLMADEQTAAKAECDPVAPVQMVTTPNSTQRRAMELVEAITV